MVTYDSRPSAFTQLTSVADWESLLTGMGLPDGIDATAGNAMAPTLDTGGRNAVIASGNVIIKGQLWRCDAPVNTPVPAASAQNRIDRLVLRYNRGATSSPTVVQPVVITGTPSGSPVEPPLVQTPTGIYDVPVSSWTSTSAGAITSLVDERQFCLDTWHAITASGWTGVLRVKKAPPTWRAVFVDIHLTSNTGTAGGAASTFGNLPDPTYYPLAIARFPVAMRGGYPASSGGSFAGLPAWAFVPTGSGGIQVVIPPLTASQIVNLDVSGFYFLD
jgi:hypothetical protein